LHQLSLFFAANDDEAFHAVYITTERLTMVNRSATINGSIIFSETQQFRAKWLWAILICCVLISTTVTVATVVWDETNRLQGTIALAILIPLEGLMIYLFYTVKLETAVTSEGVFYRWWPFFRKYSFIDKNEIELIEPGINPALSYGFHNIPGYGRVHNTGPGKGMVFVLKNRRKIFIGSQRLDDFQSALERLR